MGENVNLDSLLDGTLDDIADLPQFKVFPSGAYNVQLKEGFVQKEINNHPAIELKMVCTEVLELNNAADEADAPKPGDECSIAFMMDNEIGQGKFKEAIKNFAAMAGTSNIRTCMEASKGAEVMVVIKRTHKDEGGERKYYANLQKLEVLG